MEQSWLEFNRNYLMVSILLAFHEFQFYLDENREQDYQAPITLIEKRDSLNKQLNGNNSVDILSQRLKLSDFEQKILLLCAGVQLHTDYANIISQANKNHQLPHPSFALLLNSIPSAHWDSISPQSPLRKWNLIEVEQATLLVNSPIKINEEILHFLSGFQLLDEQLSFFIQPVVTEHQLVDSQTQLADTICQNILTEGNQRVIELTGKNSDDKLQIAKTVSQSFHSTLYKTRASTLPNQLNDIHELIKRWNRFAILTGASLFIDFKDFDQTTQLMNPVNLFVEHCQSLIFLGHATQNRVLFDQSLTYTVEMISSQEQLSLWLDKFHRDLDRSELGSISTQFNLSARAITNTINQIHCNENLETQLWLKCREQTQPALDELAQRIHTLATWDDIVLHAEVIKSLKEIVSQVRYRHLVYGDGGFAKKTARGLGISALFHGESGTGKTMAAEVIANELNLNLYRVDLSQVVNKYIGETEKNLKKIFDAAEYGGSILLFDEADSLFGKRSEVSNSNDRYSNLQIGYLLQRMEEFNGLSILTTNLKTAIDKAFERRIRFSIDFERPNQKQRQKIWKNSFVNKDWLNGVDYSKLSQLNLAGGNIRNISMNAAFLAAAEGEKIGMKHLLEAAKSEYKKIDKRMSNIEMKNWNGAKY